LGVAARRKDETSDERQGLMLRLPKNLHSALRHLSIDRGISLNGIITEVLEDWWSKQPERAKYGAPKERKTTSR
jgi:predicted HicB family RNase H-like nuclease